MRLAFIHITILLLVSIGHLYPQCPNNIWDSTNDGATYIDGLGQKAIYGDFTNMDNAQYVNDGTCLLYTSPSPRDRQKSRMPSSA